MSEEASSPKTLWLIDSTHPEEGDKIRASLRDVKDPEIGFDIIELGLVREVQRNDDSLHLKMILTTPFCPYGPALLEMARSKAQEASGLETTIEMSIDVWDPSLMEDSAAASWGLF
jgi:metal-sulfur cluster biosynthetic enzyme